MGHAGDSAAVTEMFPGAILEGDDQRCSQPGPTDPSRWLGLDKGWVGYGEGDSPFNDCSSVDW